jgi:CDP-glucose 4,6-dehydratase
MTNEIYSFYRNKTVLVTGHTGFKGSWLTIWLKHMGANVIGIALDPVSKHDLFTTSNIKSKITDHRVDIRDIKRIEKIVQHEKPEVVFHLAAQAFVLQSYKDPITTFETNITGTANVLEACRKSESVRQIVVITTDKVYENCEHLQGYRETDSLGGHDPYSASKAGAEIVTQSYFRSFFSGDGFLSVPGRSIATARAGNVIGGGDWSADRIIPDCIRSLESKRPIVLRNPDSIRPWQHVLDALGGYLLLAFKMAQEPLRYNGAWNFGPEESDFVSVKCLVDSVIKHWGWGSWVEETGTNRPHEATILRLDITKSKTYLNWYPVSDFDDSVRMVVYWYKNFAKQDSFELCIEQINHYVERWNLRSKK